ncbi:serine/threonine protein kinase [Ramlibacter ginsenosidimutans]|uniref:Serine/threonine protein kinase n=1 Tax=Ramlibacter ginsenosidimutans TaxID=502333 RepID=A0A934WPB6_9BURK|nr:serine/threonine-protein kinase [Ramlibacter ginsenosidimutans]MBK6008343.1 serine/threonine protein kinase [Ramlibacter ginsenosidimutans]
MAHPLHTSLAGSPPRPFARDAGGFDAPPRVPGYRFLRAIGRGRRTCAWLVFDLNRRAHVVLKLEAAPGASVLHDGAVAARVQGPHLVRVLGQGHTAEWNYLAMEHVAGGDLAAQLGQPMLPTRAMSLLAQAAEGLAQLHRLGLVHRDVKPANFLLRADGSLVLTDFGLVTQAGSAGATPGTLLGTARYIAPEQLQGAPAAPSADVYSLGLLLHEMLCGRPAFAGETLTELLAQQLIAEPARLPASAAAVQPLLDRMLCKDPRGRLADADAVLGLLGPRT